MAVRQTRRRFLATLALAGGPGLFDVSRARASEAPLESTTLRLVKQNGICTAPALVADELLRAEGFTDLVPVPLPSSAEVSQTVGSGRADFGLHFSAAIVAALDAGLPLTVLAGVHIGCFELFGHDNVRSITDLKGKSVGVPALGSSPHVFLSAMAANVGLDPASDISWVSSPSPRPIDLFADGKIDAFLGFPPEPKEAEDRHLGHLVVNSAVDRPWSEYFCCMVVGNRDFVRNHPVASKRVVRAILKATDLCAREPARVARSIVDEGYTPRYDYAVATVRELPYDQWRVYDPEDTMRFYALRLREAGMIKSTPQKIIAEGTDWRFLGEIKRELKA
jgi:NitT/TauT family transport system substrate-binding protein